MFKVPNQYRVRKGPFATRESNGNNGMFVLPLEKKKSGIHAQCIASDGKEFPELDVQWEHVSVVLINISNSGKTYPVKRCPTWAEMCVIKDMFWQETDTVLQFHPKSSEYSSTHEYCLHLWRKVGVDHELPPSSLTGMRITQGTPKVHDHVINLEDGSYGIVKSFDISKDIATVQIINHAELKGEQGCSYSKLRFATQDEIQEHVYPDTIRK